VTTWFDIFQASVIAAFQDIQAPVDNQKLWIGPNEHHFVYAGRATRISSGLAIG
jgi:hypothetical protein